MALAQKAWDKKILSTFFNISLILTNSSPTVFPFHFTPWKKKQKNKQTENKQTTYTTLQLWHDPGHHQRMTVCLLDDWFANRQVGSFFFWFIYLKGVSACSFPFFTASAHKLKISHAHPRPSILPAELLCWKHWGAAASNHCCIEDILIYQRVAGSVALHLGFTTVFNSESLLI